MAQLSLQRWTPIYTSPALTFGTIAHDVIAEGYDLWRKEGVCPDNVWARVQINKASQKYKEESQAATLWGAKEHTDFSLIHAQVQGTLPDYFDYWKEHDFTKKKQWAQVEQRFELRHERTGIPIRGKMDGVFIIAKELWLLETKTKSQISEANIMDTLGLDLQIAIYVWALRRLLPKYRFGGVLYNVIRRTGTHQKVGEPIQVYENRLRMQIRRDPEHFFKRYHIDLEGSDLKAFEDQFDEMLNAFSNWCKDKMRSWTYGMPCINKYGRCRFVQICHMNNYHPYVQREHISPELEGD